MYYILESYQQIILLVFLIGLSGFFSASETALTGFTRGKLSEVEENNKKAADSLKEWIKKPNKMLTGILIGNNIVNILSTTVATLLVTSLTNGKSKGAVVAYVTVSMTIIILIFGEITPKLLAKNYTRLVSEKVIKPISILSWLCTPITFLLMIISRAITVVFGLKIKEESLLITADEIKSVVSAGSEEGVLEEEEKAMIHSIVEFGDTVVKEVMVPRTSMFALEATRTLEDSWDEIFVHGFSRIPVYKDIIDNIIGIIYLKDLFEVVRSGELDKPIENYVREAYFVPETKDLVEMLEEFKEKQVHMAVILDEYGGTNGIVTIEDLLEEIVGEIKDEFDEEEEEEIKKLDEKSYVILGKVDLDKINEELGISIPSLDDYDSVGGYISYELGKVPDLNDVISNEDYEIKVVEIENRRVNKVKIDLKGDNVDAN